MVTSDSDKREEHKKIKRDILVVVILVVMMAAFVFLVIHFFYGKTEDDKYMAEEGKHIVESLEEKDVLAVESHMRALESESMAKAESAQTGEDMAKTEEQKAREERLNRLNSGEEPIGPQFANTIILGDSRTEGFTLYGFLDTSQVICERGADIHSISENMDTLVNLNPQNIILSYGMNDVIAYAGDAQRFEENYRAILESLKANLPQTHIFINSILLVQENALEKNGSFQHIGEFNEAIKRLCAEMDMGYIDNTGIGEANADLYEPDGIHVGKDFYGEWMKEMILDAGL